MACAASSGRGRATRTTRRWRRSPSASPANFADALHDDRARGVAEHDVLAALVALDAPQHGVGVEDVVALRTTQRRLDRSEDRLDELETLVEAEGRTLG